MSNTEKIKQNFYFTFDHRHEHGPNGYVKIYGTSGSAREEMVRRFGVKWAFQYAEADFLPQITKYDLYRVR